MFFERTQPMRNLIATLLLLLISTAATGAHANPCVNVAHTLKSASQMLKCELSFSSTESNRKYTLGALNKAHIQVCSEASNFNACDALYEEALSLFKERLSALLLKEATAPVSYTHLRAHET